MKKTLLLSLVAAFVLVLMAVDAAPVSAVSIPEPKFPAMGSWEWDQWDPDLVGTIIARAQLPSNPAEPWLLLLTEGLQVNRSTWMCHAFPGGQFGWTAQLRVLSGTRWLPVHSRTFWQPDEEGRLVVCADVPQAGVYALFGYWEWYPGYQCAPVEEPAFCELFPEDPTCQEPTFCDLNPDHEACKEFPEDCELNPEDPTCQEEPTFCELNPFDDTCYCELYPSHPTCISTEEWCALYPDDIIRCCPGCWDQTPSF